MTNRYEQVLLTYLRHWQFWLYGAGWLAIFVAIELLAGWPLREALLFVFVALAATGPAAVIGHAKQQLSDARASLVPGFRSPHVTVAIALSLSAILLMPLLTHRALDFPLMPIVACVTVVASGFAVVVYFQSLTAVAIALSAGSLLMLEPVLDLANSLFVARGFEWFPWAVLAGGMSPLVLIFYRLAVLHEGMSEYGRVLGSRSNNGAVRSPLLARLHLALGDWRLRGMGNVFHAGAWRRIRHWMRSAELSGTKPIAAALLALFLTGLPLLTRSFGGDEAVVGIAGVLSVLMPVFCVASTWMPRRRALGYELMRPIPRQRFVREFGLAMAMDLAEWWAWLTAAGLVPVLVWAPPLPSAHVLSLVVLSAAEQVLAFGIFVSLLRMRSPQASEGSMMMSLIAVVLPVIITASLPRTPGMTLAIAAGVAALGAALAYDAYRRWCEMDLI